MLLEQVLRTVKGERPGAGAGLQEAGVAGPRDSLNICILREDAKERPLLILNARVRSNVQGRDVGVARRQGGPGLGAGHRDHEVAGTPSAAFITLYYLQRRQS